MYHLLEEIVGQLRMTGDNRIEQLVAAAVRLAPPRRAEQNGQILRRFGVEEAQALLTAGRRQITCVVARLFATVRLLLLLRLLRLLDVQTAGSVRRVGVLQQALLLEALEDAVAREALLVDAHPERR